VGDALQHCLKAFIFLADLPVGSAFLKIKKLVDNKLGLNPCFVRGREEEGRLLPKSSKCKLRSGDIICLCGFEYPFRLTYSCDNEVPKDSVGGKRKRQSSKPPLDEKDNQTPTQERKKKRAEELQVETPKSVEDKHHQQATPTSGKQRGLSWSDQLRGYITHPEAYSSDTVYQFDDNVVVIYDKYPKSLYHLLIMPRKQILDFSVLTRADLPLLHTLRETAVDLYRQHKARYPTAAFRVGFHAVPSMRQLHVHFISQDFNGLAFKTKKHWNSFTTKFFIDIDEFISILTKKGKIEVLEVNSKMQLI
jgi:aprataxin